MINHPFALHFLHNVSLSTYCLGSYCKWWGLEQDGCFHPTETSHNGNPTFPSPSLVPRCDLKVAVGTQFHLLYIYLTESLWYCLQPDVQGPDLRAWILVFTDDLQLLPIGPFRFKSPYWYTTSPHFVVLPHEMGKWKLQHLTQTNLTFWMLVIQLHSMLADCVRL